MQRVEYQPLIVGKEPVDEPPGCHNSFQDVTFVISLVVQLAVLIFSLVTLGLGNPPPLLQLILVLETIVQGVEVRAQSLPYLHATRLTNASPFHSLFGTRRSAPCTSSRSRPSRSHGDTWTGS